MATYSGTMKIYETDGETLDTSVFSGGIVTPYFDLTMNFDAMGGCLGASFNLAGSVRDDFALPEGGVIVVWHDDDDDPIYRGAITSHRCAKVEEDYHYYECRGLWDRVENADTSVWGEGLELGTVPGTEETTVAQILERIWTDVLDDAGILWDAEKIIADVDVASLKLAEGIELKRVLQELAYIASTSATVRVVIGVDGTGTLYCLPVSTEEDDLQTTIEVGIRLAAAEEQAAGFVANRIRVISDRVIPAGVGNFGHQSRMRFQDDTSITAHGASKRRILPVTGIYAGADLSKFATGWLARNATPTRRLETVTHYLEADARPPLPWLGMARYVDSGRDPELEDDLFFPAVTLHFEDKTVGYEIDLGDSNDERLGSGDMFSQSVVNNITEQNFPGILPYDVTDEVPPPEDEDFRLYSPIEDGPGGGGGGGSTTLERGTVVSLQPGAMIYNSATDTGETTISVVKVANGGTALSSTAVRLKRQRLNSSGGVQSVVTTVLTRIKTENDIETWTDADDPYEVVADDYKHKIGVDVITASSPSELHEYYPSHSGADVDWDKAAYVAVIDPSGGGAFVAQPVQAVGWAV